MNDINIAVLVEENTTHPDLQGYVSSEIQITGTFHNVNQLINHTVDWGRFVTVIYTNTVNQQTLINIRNLAIKLPYAKILLIASHISPQEASYLMQTRVTGLLLESEISERLTSTLRSVFLGRVVISPSLLHNLVNEPIKMQ